MADIEFIIEAPQSTRANRKRPRLVTSCDQCRVKKIKCVQQPATGKCEACVSANLACLYRDREQYFAERSRTLSGAGSALRDASASAQKWGRLSAIHASSPASSPGASPPLSSQRNNSASTTPDRSDSPSCSCMGTMPLDLRRFSPFPSGPDLELPHQTWDDPLQPLSWTTQTGQTPDIRCGLEICPPLSTPTYPPTPGLFDPINQQQPHPILMITFLHVFFDRLGSTYPFLSSETVCKRFLDGRLSPLLANAIAASAARFSTMNVIVRIGPANAADVFCQAAKNLIPPEGMPSLDLLHALILLAWAECRRGHPTMFNVYTRMVTKHAADLGISDDFLPRLTRVTDIEGAHMLRATWQGVQLLERTLLAAELIALSSGSQIYYRQPSPHSVQHRCAMRSVTSIW